MVLCMARQEVQERIHHIVEKHGDNASAQIRELEKVVEEARRHGDIVLAGAAYQAIASTYLDLDNLMDAFDNGLNIPNKKNPHGGRITLSVGISSIAVDTQARTIANVISSADKAMYQAKSAGKNAIYQLSCKNDGATSYVRVGF